MAIARPRTARTRRQTGWLQLAVIGVVAVVGGTALWTSLQYSEAHAAARATADQEQQLPAQQAQEASVQPAAAVDEGEAAADSGGPGGGKEKSDPSASLAAWTEITTLPTGESGIAVTGSSKQEEEEQQQQEQRQQQAGEQAEEQPAAAGGGPNPGDKFVTVELRVPKMPPTFNSWVLVEDMLLFHRRALQQQLEQAYVALGLAAAAGRAFVLPEFSCFCQNSEVPLPRCRRPDSDAVAFPVPCPEGEVLQPLVKLAEPGGAGTPLRVLPHAALHSMEMEESKVLVLKPSATILWPACAQSNGDPNQQCTYESGLESGATQLLLPPSLNDTHLLPFLDKYQRRFPLWRLDLSDIGSHWHAFAGWDCAEPARQFDLRLRGAAKPWPAPSGGGLQPMNLTSGRVYSDEPDMKDCPGGSALRRMHAARLQA